MIDSESLTRYSSIESVIVEEAERTSNNLLAGLCLISLIGVPVSVSRTFIIGWQPVYWIHIGALVAVVTFYLLRHRLPVWGKAGSLLVIAQLVSLSGLLNFGIFGNGALWGAFSLLIASMFLGQRSVLLASGSFIKFSIRAPRTISMPPVSNLASGCSARAECSAPSPFHGDRPEEQQARRSCR